MPLCRKLGYDPNRVAHLHISPGHATVTVYKHNEHGSKYIDLAPNEPATYTRTFKWGWD